MFALAILFVVPLIAWRYQRAFALHILLYEFSLRWYDVAAIECSAKQVGGFGMWARHSEVGECKSDEEIGLHGDGLRLNVQSARRKYSRC